MPRKLSSSYQKPWLTLTSLTITLPNADEDYFYSYGGQTILS